MIETITYPKTVKIDPKQGLIFIDKKAFQFYKNTDFAKLAGQIMNAHEKLHTQHHVAEIIQLVSATRLPLHDEKELQAEIERLFAINGINYSREWNLDKNNIPDFFINGIAVEVKIKGSKRNIYKQCERYCQFTEVSALVLVTNRSMGFPQEINSKPCYVVNLGQAWL